MPDSQNPSEIYTQLLLPKGHGCPIWCPEPDENLPPEYRETGVRIGDVGRIMPGGGFDPLFNICVEAHDPINRDGVPDGFEPQDLQASDVTIRRRYHGRGSHVCSEPLERESGAFERGIVGYKFTCSSTTQGAVLLMPDGASRIELRSRKTHFRQYALQNALQWYQFANQRLDREVPNGSLILVTGCDMASSWGIASFSDAPEDTEVKLSFTPCYRDNDTSSCAYLWESNVSASVRSSSDLEEGPAINQINIGVHRRLQYQPTPETVADLHSLVPSQHPYRVDASRGTFNEVGGFQVNITLPGFDASPNHVDPNFMPLAQIEHSRQAPDTSITSAEEVGPFGHASTTPNQNQCLFVRGFRISVRQGILATAFRRPPEISKVTDATLKDIFGSNNSFIPFSPLSGESKSWFGGGAPSTSPQMSGDQRENFSTGLTEGEEQETCFSEVILESLSTASEPYHPSQITNRYLLDSCPQAVVAVTHDDEWFTLMRKDDITIPEEEELIHRLLDKFELVTGPIPRGGLPYLNDTGDLRGVYLQEKEANICEPADMIAKDVSEGAFDATRGLATKDGGKDKRVPSLGDPLRVSDMNTSTRMPNGPPPTPLSGKSNIPQHPYATITKLADRAEDNLIFKNIVTLSMEQCLKSLKPAAMDASDRLECLPDTRVDLVKTIQDWANNTTSNRNVFWLHGRAGSGKSTLSTTVAKKFRENGQLGAFLFFARDVTERSDPTNVIRTLAYQLGLCDPQIGASIAAVVENIPTIYMSPLRLQFTKLIVEPLSTIERATKAPLVVILDALDECGNAKQRWSLLALLAAESHRLPSVLRMFITSRPELDIRSAFESQIHVLAWELDITSKANADDILIYLRHQMSIIRTTNEHLRLGEEWPGEEYVYRLSRRASGLFAWASAASKFIVDNPRKRLEILLKEDTTSGAQLTLDALYKTTLESAGIWDNADFVNDFRSILGIILVARNPLSRSAIDSLLGTDTCSPSIYTISHLACVLAQSPTVRVLHPSFADFLMDRGRCGRGIWHIDRDLHNFGIAVKCLEQLDRLKRNVCGLTLSPDDTHGHLPQDLTYACMFWIEHICMIKNDGASIGERLHIFLHRHILHWLEAMSILGRSRETIRLLEDLLGWVKVHCDYQHFLFELVYDALRLAQAFIESIEDHPLLVYSTALPFSPTHCRLYEIFHENLTFPHVLGGFQQYWSPLLLVLSGHRSSISSVAISGDGTRVVSGSKDDTIRVWDIALGVETLPPLRGHSLGVISVAFSPDGKNVVSGSGDATVRVWDLTSGSAALPPFQGHEDAVTAVLYSPDGCSIVSGSADKTIRIWDAMTGVQMLDPLRGHTDRVSSVAMTPDGLRIVSGSMDGTIRIWDRKHGGKLLAWVAHAHYISSVHVSPDGMRIVSGSADASIRLWDAFSGAKLLDPLRGHKNGVSSVMFSPDGKTILSGSEDKTVRVWDAILGAEVFDALDGHDRYISSVAFSPDGKRIVSGSWDKTLRVWDSAILGSKSLRPVQGHRQCIFSLAFSPDGTRIASGSADATVRVWNAISGEPDLEPMQGHNHNVLSIAYSSDGKRIVSASEDETIIVWDAISGAKIQSPLMGHEDCVSTALFTNDGKRIISGSWDRTVRVWGISLDTELFEPLLVLQGHEGQVESVASSRDGRWIVSSSSDKTVRMWDATSGAEAYPPLPDFEGGALFVDFSPDGKKILASSRDYSYIWDASLGTCISKTTQSDFVRHERVMGVSSGWVRNPRTNKNICKLPPAVTDYTIASSAASKDSIALGFESGQLLIIQFPVEPHRE